MDMNYETKAVITVTMDQDEAVEVSYVLRQGLQIMDEAGETNSSISDLRDTLADWARQ